MLSDDGIIRSPSAKGLNMLLVKIFLTYTLLSFAAGSALMVGSIFLDHRVPEKLIEALYFPPLGFLLVGILYAALHHIWLGHGPL